MQQNVAERIDARREMQDLKNDGVRVQHRSAIRKRLVEVLGCTFDDYYDRLMSSSPGSYSQRIDEQTGMLQEYSNLSRNPSRTKPETAPLNGYANYSKSSSNKKRRKEDHSNGTLGEATKPSVEVVQIGSKLGVEVERVLSDFSELLPLLSPLRSPTRMPSPVKQEARLDSPFVAQTTSKSPAIDMNGLPEGGVCRLALSVMPIERRKLLYSKWKAKKEALRAERGERDKRVSDNLSEPRDSKPKADKHRSREPCRKDTPCIVDPKLTQRSHQTEAKPEINKTNNEDFHRVEEAKAALKQASQQSHSSKTGSAGDGGSRGVTRQEDSQFQSSHTSQPIKSSATSSNEKSTTKRDKDYLSKGLDSQHSRVPSPSTVPNIKIKKEIKDHPVDRQTPQPEQLSKAALPNGDSKPTPIPKKHHHKSGDGEERREDQRESGDDYSPKAKFLLEESLEESKRTKDGYRQMACTIKWKADKMTDRIEKTLSYLEAALHFVLSAFNTDDPKGCDVEKPGHQYESLSHALDFLRTSTGNFVNGKTDSTQMRHYRRRVKVVGSMLDACLSYQLYRIRSEKAYKNYQLLKEHRKEEKSSNILSERREETPSPASSASSRPASDTRLDPPTAPKDTVQIPADIYRLQLQQNQILTHLMWAHKIWDEVDSSITSENKDFLKSVVELCGEVKLDSSPRQVVIFFGTATKWMQEKYRRCKEKVRK